MGRIGEEWPGQSSQAPQTQPAHGTRSSANALEWSPDRAIEAHHNTGAAATRNWPLLRGGSTAGFDGLVIRKRRPVPCGVDTSPRYGAPWCGCWRAAS